jgi:hypothetical protein
MEEVSVVKRLGWNIATRQEPIRQLAESSAKPIVRQRGDADAIKRYNGGLYFSIYIPAQNNQTPPEQPHWSIDKV